MARIYCFASAKGGSGKTILATSFGTLLAHLGRRCLLIDADATTNGMTLLHLEQVLAERRALSRPSEAQGLFDPGAPTHELCLSDDLRFLPSTYVAHDTQNIETGEFRERLQRVLRSAEDHTDIVLIDAQAGTDAIAIEAMEAADQVVIVSEYDPVSAKGVERLKRLIGDRVSIDRTWVLFNKVLPEFTDSLGDFLGVTRHLPPIPWSADVVRAYVRGRLALDMDKGNLFTLGLLETASVLFGPAVADLVDRWKEKKEQVIREPVRQQLAEIVDELEATENARFVAEYEVEHGESMQMRFLRAVVGSAVPLLGGAILFGILGSSELWSAAVPYLLGAAALLVASAAPIYLSLQKQETERRRSFAEQAAELGRRVRELETQKEELRAYEKASLAKVVSSGPGPVAR